MCERSPDFDIIFEVKKQKVTAEPIKFLRTLLSGVDNPKPQRALPSRFVKHLNSHSRAAVALVYENPYSTWNERFGISAIEDRSGTRPRARTRTIAMAGLLTIAQCKLCARGGSLKNLVFERFEAMNLIPDRTSAIDKLIEKWQNQLENFPMFHDMATTKDAVLCVVKINLGSVGMSDGKIREALRNMHSRVAAQTLQDESDSLVRAALLSATDFRCHSQEQLDKMISALRKDDKTFRQTVSTYTSHVNMMMGVTEDILGDTYENFFSKI